MPEPVEGTPFGEGPRPFLSTGSRNGLGRHLRSLVRGQAGFTATEVIVGLVIMAIVLPTVFAIVYQVVWLPAQGSAVLEAQAELRQGFTYLEEDAHRAQGFAGDSDPSYGAFSWKEYPGPITWTSRYFFETTAQELQRVVTGTSVLTTTVARNITTYDGVNFVAAGTLVTVTITATVDGPRGPVEGTSTVVLRLRGESVGAGIPTSIPTATPAPPPPLTTPTPTPTPTLTPTPTDTPTPTSTPTDTPTPTPTPTDTPTPTPTFTSTPTSTPTLTTVTLYPTANTQTACTTTNPNNVFAQDDASADTPGNAGPTMCEFWAHGFDSTDLGTIDSVTVTVRYKTTGTWPGTNPDTYGFDFSKAGTFADTIVIQNSTPQASYVDVPLDVTPMTWAQVGTAVARVKMAKKGGTDNSWTVNWDVAYLTVTYRPP